MTVCVREGEFWQVESYLTRQADRQTGRQTSSKSSIPTYAHISYTTPTALHLPTHPVIRSTAFIPSTSFVVSLRTKPTKITRFTSIPIVLSFVSVVRPQPRRWGWGWGWRWCWRCIHSTDPMCVACKRMILSSETKTKNRSSQRWTSFCFRTVVMSPRSALTQTISLPLSLSHSHVSAVPSGTDWERQGQRDTKKERKKQTNK